MGVAEHAEMVDKELDAFIERRASREPDPDTSEASYAESVRRFHARRRQENRAAWYVHFCRMSENHRKLSEEYEARAEALCQEGDDAA